MESDTNSATAAPDDKAGILSKLLRTIGIRQKASAAEQKDPTFALMPEIADASETADAAVDGHDELFAMLEAEVAEAAKVGVETDLEPEAQGNPPPVDENAAGEDCAGSALPPVEPERTSVEGSEVPSKDSAPAGSESQDRAARFSGAAAFRRGKKTRTHHRLGQHLIDKGLITEEILYVAAQEQAVTGEKLGQILVQNQYLSNSDRVQAILDVAAERIAQETVSKSNIPVELLEKHKIIISTVHDEGIFISTMGDRRVVEMIVNQYYPGKKITFVPYTPAKFAPFIANMRKSSDSSDLPTKETMLDRIIYRAINTGASDIHLIPRSKSYAVYLRRKGILEHEHEGPLDEMSAVAAQAKGRARMDTAKKHLPQNGSFQLEYNRKMIALRVSASPNVEGESIVIRIQDPESINRSIHALGITPLDKWLKAISRRSGICLLTGGTGTGKTTTLYSSILNFNRNEKKIATIENPVEVRISGISQVEINEAIGFDYSKALEAQLTQDPDVIVVGEIRNEETARIAIRAATSGHLVMATLHNGSITETVDRLIGLGIKDHELRYILRGIMTQDLIRTTCPSCKGTGCAHDGFACIECAGEGYSGMTVVAEGEYFHDHTDVDRLFAVHAGKAERTWQSKLENAVEKYEQGITTSHELIRLFGEPARRYVREAA